MVGWRAWNKIQFQAINCRFSCFAEGELVGNGDPVAVVDDTRLAPTFFGDPSQAILSGEVLSWNGLNITGSQPCKLSTEHSFVIHLQLKSGYIDIIPVTQGQSDFEFVLARPPVDGLVTQGEVKTVYSLSTDDRQNDDLFIVTTKSRSGVFENELTLMNLDERYYQNDSDIKNNLI